MRNKIAKKLRKEAKQITQANGFPYEEYAVKTYKKIATKLDGSPVVFQVYTAFLTNDCEKKIYKQLKKVNKDME